MKNRIEINTKCRSCAGTGLFTGIGERDGIAVICHTCKGTGCEKRVIEWENFSKREKKKNVKRVLQTNPGICCGDGKDCKAEDFGGMSFEDWDNGKPFPEGSEMRKYTCPAWWYQSVDYKKKPKWNNEKDGINCSNIGMFSQCENYKRK